MVANRDCTHVDPPRGLCSKVLSKGSQLGTNTQPLIGGIGADKTCGSSQRFIITRSYQPLPGWLATLTVGGLAADMEHSRSPFAHNCSCNLSAKDGVLPEPKRSVRVHAARPKPTFAQTEHLFAQEGGVTGWGAGVQACQHSVQS